MRAYLAALVLGIAAIIAGTVVGGADQFLAAIVSPPILVRAALVIGGCTGLLARSQQVSQ